MFLKFPPKKCERINENQCTLQTILNLKNMLVDSEFL